MTVGARKKEDIYSEMGVSNSISKVKKDVYRIIELIAQTQGFRVDQRSLPEIEISPESTSSYNRERNIIYISKDGIENGGSYAAESGRF